MFRLKPENRTSLFIELTSFQSLFLVKIQVPTLNETHYLLVELSCTKVLVKIPIL